MAENNQNSQPQSTAPDFNKLELEILKFWDDEKIFEKSLEQTSAASKDPSAAPQDERRYAPFIFYDGPPFATGLPHYGSILPSVIKDAIPRYQTMRGRYVRRRWGWDCHGLPIENIVEQNLKISGKKEIEKIGVARFNQVCRDNVLRFAEEWGKVIKRIARWVDFGPPSLYPQELIRDQGGPSAEALAKADGAATAGVALLNNKSELRNSYKTMDTGYMESVWWALKQLWDKKLIYEDRKVLLYCPRCETPISNFEVAMDNSYRDVTEESVFAKFKMLPRQRIVNDLTNDKTFALAWTTTPWTLPGNTSLNAGPDIKYVMVEQNGERYILAKDRLDILDGEYEMVAEFPARSLEGLEYEPLYSGIVPNGRTGSPSLSAGASGDPARAHRFYLADFVTTEDGTGIVHNAAMYGEEDYRLAKEKNLPRLDMLDHKGQYLGNAPKNLQGVFFKDADKVVLKELKQRDLVYKILNFTHSYPHCYRCGTPLFYNALPAWFISVQKVKKDLIKNNQDVNWYPEHLKYGRFQQGIDNAPDWNISRNRYWATALPFWKCQNKDCRHVFCVGSIEELKEKAINFHQVYPNYNPANIAELDLHKPYIDQIILKCPQCGGQSSRVPEVVDCWVESGSMPFAELHAPFENQELFKQRFPSDFVVEYIPQTRAWFYVMHVMSTILFGQAPFRNVLTTGTILGEDGTKMSKSKGNYPDPGIVIEKYGADALRFYLLTSPVVGGDDINFSEKSVQEVSRKINMLIYNMWSFLRMYENGQVGSGQWAAGSDGHILDRWVASRLSQVHAQVTADMDAYNTVRAGRAIVDFVNDVSTWYLRRSRERIKQNSGESKLALQTLGFVLVELSKILAPFTPFLADFIYKDLTGKLSVHLEQWTGQLPAADQKSLDDMALLRGVVENGLSLRKENNLKVRQPLAELEYHLNGKNNFFVQELEKVLADELNVKLVSGRSDFVPKAGWAYRETPAFKLALNLELSEHLKKEGAARELERLVQDLRKKSGLQVGQLVDIYYNIADDYLEQALLNLFDRKKTFVSQIQKNLEVEVDFETQGEVEGKAVWVGMILVV